MERTKGKWIVGKKAADFVVSESGDFIAKCRKIHSNASDESKANAEFICRAVNSHTALRDALESLVKALDGVDSAPEFGQVLAIEKARAVLESTK